MSGRGMPKCPAFASKSFSSTPVKANEENQKIRGLDDAVVSDDEDTFSLLSPIYHDSFDSDESDEEELGCVPAQQISSRLSTDRRLGTSSVR